MHTSVKHSSTSTSFSSRRAVGKPHSLGYWLPWILLIAALALGLNAYFDFRNRELDKRLEQINISLRRN